MNFFASMHACTPLNTHIRTYTHNQMMMHAQSGVEKGRSAARGMPVEIMGKLVGVPDENDEHCVIVLDAKVRGGEIKRCRDVEM